MLGTSHIMSAPPSSAADIWKRNEPSNSGPAAFQRPADTSYTARARAAAEVARAACRRGRCEPRAFPSEAFAEMRKQRLLGVQVPEALGGEGATLADLADVCYVLGQALLVHRADLRHASDQDGLHRAPSRRATPALERILRASPPSSCCMASSTTEGQAGGNVRSSEAARRARRR